MAENNVRYKIASISDDSIHVTDENGVECKIGTYIDLNKIHITYFDDGKLKKDYFYIMIDDEDCAECNYSISFTGGNGILYWSYKKNVEAIDWATLYANTDTEHIIDNSISDIPNHKKVYFKGNMTFPSENETGKFTVIKHKNGEADTNAKFNIGGNLLSLNHAEFDEAEYNSKTVERGFQNMFAGTSVVDATAVKFPDKINNYACKGMFNGCTLLTGISTLSATEIGNEGYHNMFNGCASLRSNITLNMTTIGVSACTLMFKGCSSISSVSDLLPRQSQNNCYQEMFAGCSSLTGSPKIDLENIGVKSCLAMFSGCSNITTFTKLPQNSVAQECFKDMFSGCENLTAFTPSLNATGLTNNCYSGMFRNCKKLKSAPTINAKTMASGCCAEMFKDCSSITTIPTFVSGNTSDITLANACFSGMFENCTSITANSLTFSTFPRKESCYENMFMGCDNLTPSTIEIPACHSNYDEKGSLARNCCKNMFAKSMKTGANYCKANLETHIIPQGDDAYGCYQYMFRECQNLSSLTVSLNSFYDEDEKNVLPINRFGTYNDLSNNYNYKYKHVDNILLNASNNTSDKPRYIICISCGVGERIKSIAGSPVSQSSLNNGNGWIVATVDGYGNINRCDDGYQKQYTSNVPYYNG